jgi:endonuclease/exonuclease/phosphatase family metal-dependent hydrolase
MVIVSHTRTAWRERTLGCLRALVGWLLVACGVWSIGRLCGCDRFPLLAGVLVPILAFTPYAAMASVMVTVGATAMRRWTIAGVALAVVGAFAVAVLPRAVGNTVPTTRGPVFRILTMNLHFGQTNAEMLVDLVRRLRVDVLSVQDLSPQTAAAFVRDGLGALLPFKVTALIGSSGSGLYSRYRLHELPMPPLAVTGPAMPRADVDVPTTGKVEVRSVHLARPVDPAGVEQWIRGFSWLPPGRPHQAVRIMAGDFNATLDHASLRGLLASGYVDAAAAVGAGLIPTYRQRLWPPITIDHVLVDAVCAVRRVAVYNLPRSDHGALFAELRLP